MKNQLTSIHFVCVILTVTDAMRNRADNELYIINGSHDVKVFFISVTMSEWATRLGADLCLKCITVTIQAVAIGMSC
jgi:hypothetical protein